MEEKNEKEMLLEGERTIEGKKPHKTSWELKLILIVGVIGLGIFTCSYLFFQPMVIDSSTFDPTIEKWKNDTLGQYISSIAIYEESTDLSFKNKKEPYTFKATIFLNEKFNQLSPTFQETVIRNIKKMTDRNREVAYKKDITCTIQKVLLFANPNYYTYETDDNTIEYYYQDSNGAHRMRLLFTLN